ncbi:Hypothetical predicted protein [Mytilus galloprovincialis]|uniref:Uncharacterized protein n=1 Tax=Mytilus galloprovincialis TaxID=29158 RepID=A0A8B6BP70_MYTGA|nr:Hypothetical predicted protein [Mytilus galloprovincialis]
MCKKSTKTEDEETEPDLKVLIQQINTRLEKIEKGAPIYTGAPENSDAQGYLGVQGYSDTSGYTGAPRFNNPSGYSGARGSQPYRGGYRGNNTGYRGYNRGFQPRYNDPNFTPNTNYNKDIPIICRRYLAFGLVTEKQRKPQTKYVQELREILVKAYESAAAHARKAQAKQKEGYDLRARGAAIEKGDKVLVRKVAFDGKHKISDKWENEPKMEKED